MKWYEGRIRQGGMRLDPVGGVQLDMQEPMRDHHHTHWEYHTLRTGVALQQHYATWGLGGA